MTYETLNANISLIFLDFFWINMLLSRKRASEQIKVTLWQENSVKPSQKGLNYAIDS